MTSKYLYLSTYMKLPPGLVFVKSVREEEVRVKVNAIFISFRTNVEG